MEDDWLVSSDPKMDGSAVLAVRKYSNYPGEEIVRVPAGYALIRVGDLPKKDFNYGKNNL